MHRKTRPLIATGMQPIRGLIFDFDNTLVDSEHAYSAGLGAIGIEAGDKRYAQARQEVKARLGSSNTQSHHRLLYFKQLWPDASPEHLLSTHRAYEDAVTADIALQWQALSRQRLLSGWRGRYRMVILTNETARTQLAKWRACDPEGALFDGLISSEEVGVEKPHPDMFKTACARLDLAPQACLMVGDSMKDDIAPARQLGMRAWHTTEFSSTPKAYDAAMGIPTLRTLAELDTHLV